MLSISHSKHSPTVFLFYLFVLGGRETIALHTGMRRGEIFNLKWFDLDFDRGLIQVRKTKTKFNRVVPINARVR